MTKLDYSYKFYQPLLLLSQFLSLGEHSLQEKFYLKNLSRNSFAKAFCQTNKIDKLIEIVEDSFSRLHEKDLLPSFMPATLGIEFTNITKRKASSARSDDLAMAFLKEDKIQLNLTLMDDEKRGKKSSLIDHIIHLKNKEYAQFVILHEVGHLVIYHLLDKYMGDELKNELFSEYYSQKDTTRSSELRKQVRANISEGFAESFAIYAYAMLNPDEKILLPFKYSYRLVEMKYNDDGAAHEIDLYDIDSVYEEIFHKPMPQLTWQQLVGLCLYKCRENIEQVINDKLQNDDFKEKIKEDKFLSRFLVNECQSFKLTALESSQFCFDESIFPHGEPRYQKPSVIVNGKKMGI